jgi:ABC-type cobalamin/Fe3+-siderophores transport system ATPase subunit
MEGSLSLRSVWLSYPRGPRHVVRVLTDVSLDVHAGEVVAVLARRAQGKTSLLRVAAGMARPDRGSVSFAGRDMWRPVDARGRRALRQRHRRARALSAPIALVRPAPPDLDIPVGEGIALPLTGAYTWRQARELAEQALEEVGAGECAPRRWSELSDGERARVAIAQAIARDPKMLLVDDLTATLGIGETEHVAGLLGALAREREIAVLTCAGGSDVTSRADRVVSLGGGELSSTATITPRPALERPVDGNVIDFPGERQRRAST